MRRILVIGARGNVRLNLPHFGHCRESDRKSTRLNSSHEWISYAVFCLKKKKKEFALDVCSSVMDEWQPGPGREIILTFSFTVERPTSRWSSYTIYLMCRKQRRLELLCV